MKGLLIKDLHLMKTQQRFFIIVIAIAIIMALSMSDNFFLLGYMTFVIPLFSLSTIGYDEFDNGNAFLFTLPVSRKEYVYEKYCLGILLGAMSLVLGICLSVIFLLINNTPISETLTASPFIFETAVVFLSVMIPIQLKFGADKGRIAMLMTFGIVGVLGYGIVQILKHFDIDITAFLQEISELNLGTAAVITAVIVIVLLLLSVQISIAIMNKKEF